MKKMWKLAMGSMLAASLVLTGCGSDKEGAAGEGGKLKIVTTFYPMHEFSKQVAGDHADVTVLVPGGTEPHDWEPTAKDMARISEADVFVYNGAGFEGWVEDVLANLNGSKVKVVEATEGLELMHGEEHDHDHGGHEDEKKDAAKDEHGHEGEAVDPHVWTDPVLAQEQVRNIADALIEVDKEHAEDYNKNAASYIEKLKALDESFKSGLADAKQKEFVTAHASFAYLAQRYGLTQEPISGLSPEHEPSATEMKHVVEFAKEHNVKTIFFETLVSPKVAEAVAKEIGAKTAVLNPLEGLTDEEKAKGLDYIKVMEQNLEALKQALNQ